MYKSVHNYHRLVIFVIMVVIVTVIVMQIINAAFTNVHVM